MAAETGNHKKSFFRKPIAERWYATSMIIIYAVWCLLLIILAATGHLLNSQSLECGKSEVDLVPSRLKSEASLVYLWSGLCLAVCILLLLELWRKGGFFVTVLLLSSLVLLVIKGPTFNNFAERETKEIEDFKERYLNMLPVLGGPGYKHHWLADTTCSKLKTVYRWHTEFNCCGLHGYQDWKSSIPDSCLCDGEDNSSMCVGVGNVLVYEKPCLPTVVSLAEKRSSTLWTIMIVWIILTGAPIAISVLGAFILYYMLALEACYIWLGLGGYKLVPVVFIKKSKNNQTEEENSKDVEPKEGSGDDGVVLDVEDGTDPDGGVREEEDEDEDDNPVVRIFKSEVVKMQAELDPPPVRHRVQCSCISHSKSRDFYTILLEEDSVWVYPHSSLVDPNRPTRRCFWAEGPHVFTVDHIVWPRERNPTDTAPLL